MLRQSAAPCTPDPKSPCHQVRLESLYRQAHIKDGCSQSVHAGPLAMAVAGLLFCFRRRGARSAAVARRFPTRTSHSHALLRWPIHVCAREDTSGPGGYYYRGLPAWAHGYVPSSEGDRAELNLTRILKAVSYLNPHIDESGVVSRSTILSCAGTRSPISRSLGSGPWTTRRRPVCAPTS